MKSDSELLRASCALSDVAGGGAKKLWVSACGATHRVIIA